MPTFWVRSTQNVGQTHVPRARGNSANFNWRTTRNSFPVFYFPPFIFSLRPALADFCVSGVFCG
ncbi:MAG: hypothetical protein NTX39_02975 [Opitutae bacterium]|nr:hypothetical protein [Opitutae bacterium]